MRTRAGINIEKYVKDGRWRYEGVGKEVKKDRCYHKVHDHLHRIQQVSPYILINARVGVWSSSTTTREGVEQA